MSSDRHDEGRATEAPTEHDEVQLEDEPSLGLGLVQGVPDRA